MQNARIDFKHLLSLLSPRENEGPTTAPLGNPDTPFADKMSNSRHDMNIYGIYGSVSQNLDFKKWNASFDFKYFLKPHAISAKLHKKMDWAQFSIGSEGGLQQNAEPRQSPSRADLPQ